MNQRSDRSKPHPQPERTQTPREPAPSEKTTRDPDGSGADPSRVEGEGSYTATRRYNEGLQEHLRDHDVESEAETARQAWEGGKH